MLSSFSVSRFDTYRRLSSLRAGTRATVRGVLGGEARADRLAALGITPGSRLQVLETFPGVVFMCDETEIAVEPAVAKAILVEPD